MLKQPLLMLSRSGRVKDLVTRMPVSSGLVARFVPGETADSAVDAVQELASQGLRSTLDFLGEDTLDRGQADDTVHAYVEVLEALSAHGLADKAEVSVKLTAVGLALSDGGEQVAVDNVRRICAAARNAGTTVTIDMEDSTTTDATLRIVEAVREDYPDTGAVLQAYLHRTEDDCRRLATAGSRVRLCKGAYREPESVAYQAKIDVDRSYVRCLKVLMEGEGYPMVASHDPRILEIADTLARRAGREKGTYEYQMLYGIRPDEQRRLAESGETMRVYIPYGIEWYGYLMRRLAERPQNLTFFLRSLASKS